MSTKTFLADPVEMIRNGAPRLIESEAQLQEYTETLERLDDIENPTMEQWAAMDLLTLLIEQYEEKHYPIAEASSIEVLRFMMDQHSLKQRDLAPLLGAESIVSEILSGKRKMTVTHIQKLSRRFHVSPEVFFPSVTEAKTGRKPRPAGAAKKSVRAKAAPPAARARQSARQKKSSAA